MLQHAGDRGKGPQDPHGTGYRRTRGTVEHAALHAVGGVVRCYAPVQPIQRSGEAGPVLCRILGPRPLHDAGRAGA